MMNLKDETLECLKIAKRGAHEVEFVTDGETSCMFTDFLLRAKDINYDDGFGGNEVNLSLKVVGADFWLERCEYDGSEWWEFKTLPTKPLKSGAVKILERETYEQPQNSSEG